MVPSVELVPVDRHSVVNLKALATYLAADQRPVIVVVILADNETGVIQPVTAVLDIMHVRSVLLHSDSAQAAGKIVVNIFLVLIV